MPDEQDEAEALDDDELTGEFPPDKLIGAEAYGAAGVDSGVTESVERRAAREEPEELPLESPPTSGDVDEVVLDPTDDFSDDPDLRDVVQEREAPEPAEEAAIHVIDEGVGGFDSEVDDPDLAEAYEIDPEIER